MERDFDLCRKILMEVEAKSDPHEWLHGPPHIEGHSDAKVLYHVWLLAQAGLLEAKFPGGNFSETCAIRNLTWAGHEFLEASRDESLWEKAKRLVLEKTGTLTFEALKLALMEAMKRTLA